MAGGAVALRRAGEQVPAITGLRLWPVGCRAILVNISTSGLLARGATRVAPGTTVKVFFEGEFSPPAVDGQVVRCDVATLDAESGVLYHVGIAFTSPIALDDAPTAGSAGPEPDIVAAPARNRW